MGRRPMSVGALLAMAACASSVPPVGDEPATQVRFGRLLEAIRGECPEPDRESRIESAIALAPRWSAAQRCELVDTIGQHVDAHPGRQRAILAILITAASIDGSAPTSALLDGFDAQDGVRSVLSLRIVRQRGVDARDLVAAIERVRLCEGATTVVSVATGPTSGLGVSTDVEPELEFSRAYVELCAADPRAHALMPRAVRWLLREGSEQDARLAIDAATKVGWGDPKLFDELLAAIGRTEPAPRSLRRRCAAMVDG